MFSYLPTYQNAQMVLEDTKIRWQRHQVLWSYKVKCYILIYNRHTNEEVKTQLCDHWFTSYLMLKG